MCRVCLARHACVHFMKDKFANVWIDPVLQQACNYRLTRELMTKGMEACLQVGPQTRVDCCMPPSDERLNPLEFHGKRCAEGPRRPQASQCLV